MGEAPVAASSEDKRAAKLEGTRARAPEPLIGLIAESFMASLPPDVAARLTPWLETPAGKAAFRSQIIDTYFDALATTREPSALGLGRVGVTELGFASVSIQCPQ
jgi:hypothetical protein